MRDIATRSLWILTLAMALVTGAMMLGCGSPDCVGDQEARDIAGRRLVEYVEREKLEGVRFSPPEINHTAGLWDVTFRAVSSPHHLVVVLVHCDGGSEVSRSVEP